MKTMFGLPSFWGIIALLCAVWVIYDIYTNQKKMSTETKLLWTVLAIVLNILTAIVYYIVYKR